MANSQHKYLLERGWSQQQIDEVIRKAHEWLRGAGYTPLTEQGHWNGMMGSTQSYHLPSREKNARGMPEAFVEMLKGGKILDASRVHKFSRPGAKDMMAASEQAMALYRKLNSSGTAITSNNWREWDRLASSAMKMPDFTPAGQSESLHDLANEVGIEIQALKSRASRPGAKARFKVEDRFYFGKGRKERFAEPREIEAKIRAWIDSRGLPIGLQETNALSYIAAQNMLRGGVSIEQAVKSAARRHAQIGLASAGLRTWLGENA